MAVDLDKIRKKIAEMNGQIKKTSAVQLWKPGVGEYVIRALPWSDQPDGEPIKERSFYYVGDNKAFLAPSQFGKEDPIEDLRRALFQSKQPEEKILAKTLFPKVSGYLRIVDRGNEEAGVQIWKFSKTINSRLLGFFVDEDCGDFLDIMEGYDLKVKVSQVLGKKYLDFQVDYRTKSTPLHSDEKKREVYMGAVQNLDELHPYAFKTTQQIDVMVNSWLNGDPIKSDEGMSKGSKEVDTVDSLAKDLSSFSKKEKEVVEEKTTKASKTTKAPTKKIEEELDESVPTTASSLDDAFADLMQDD